MYLIALRLSLAGCAAHSPTAYLTYAKQHGLDALAGLLFVRFRSAFRFYVVVNFVMYLGPSIQNVSSRNLSTLLEISRRHDHTQQDLVRSLEVLLYFMSFYFTLLYITLLYFELRWQHIPYYTMLYYLWYKV